MNSFNLRVAFKPNLILIETPTFLQNFKNLPSFFVVKKFASFNQFGYDNSGESFAQN